MTHLCPVCRSNDSIVLESRDIVPIAQNLMFETREKAMGCATGRLEMALCGSCGFVWNAAFDPKLLVYDATYENDQTFSPAFDRHLRFVTERIAKAVDSLDSFEVVEVGCGQGYFIQRMADVFGERVKRIQGFDPAFKSPDQLPARSRVVPEYFGPQSAKWLDASPALVVSRHTIEHVPDPIAFLSAIRSVVDEGTILVIETPDVGWILKGAVAQDFFYEHCSIFDPESITAALHRSGFEVEEVHSVFDGQYQLAVARAAKAPSDYQRRTPVDEHDYRARRAAFVSEYQTAIEADVSAGRNVAFWGGASKGVTLALLLGGPDAPIACAIDINPRRQGRFMPLSGIEVVSPEEAVRRGVSAAYVMNPAYSDEIAVSCSEKGLPISLR